jgi:hypothetical protein
LVRVLLCRVIHSSPSFLFSRARYSIHHYIYFWRLRYPRSGDCFGREVVRLFASWT